MCSAICKEKNWTQPGPVRVAKNWNDTHTWRMTGTGCNTFCRLRRDAQNENTKQTCERTCFVLCRCSHDYDVSFPYYRVLLVVCPQVRKIHRSISGIWVSFRFCFIRWHTPNRKPLRVIIISSTICGVKVCVRNNHRTIHLFLALEFYSVLGGT